VNVGIRFVNTGGLIGSELSGLCWLEGLHRLNRRGLCETRHGLHWRGLFVRGRLGWRHGSLSRFKNLSGTFNTTINS